ncbi:hypothetical protein PG994_012473 [Apiospora phragmitis]|uniref:Glutathione S-transferase n=1 Tax=Apiospora phragmitis TaxID=2905665 RepID=A0ABR1TVT3_9PEZI
MVFGTIYTRNPNPRTTAILAVAKAQGLSLDITYHDRDDPKSHQELLKVNPLGQVPVFRGSDGYGSTQQEYYSVIRWMSFANGDLLPAIGGIILPVIRQPIDVRMDDQDCLRVLRRDCQLMEEQLQKSRYLVGDQLTLADLFTVAMLQGAYVLLHQVLKPAYPRLTEWVNEVFAMPMFQSIAGPLHELNLPVPALLGIEKRPRGLSNGSGSTS